MKTPVDTIRACRLGIGAFLLAAAVALAIAPRADAFVYWGDGNAGTLERANLNGTGVDPDFITGIVQGPRGIAVDGAHLYWANRNENTIGRANLDGTAVDNQFIPGAADPRGVVVDAAHVYWTNTDDGTIGRADLDGSDPDQSFIDITTNNVTDVAVDATHIYWTDAPQQTIGRANLNGSLPDEDFFDVEDPVGVAVNAAHIYWASFTTFPPSTAGAIGRADIDGTDPDQFLIPDPKATNPSEVALDGAHVYWTNTNSGTIGRANLNGTGANHDFITGLSFLSGLAVDPLSAPTCQPTAASTGYAEPVGMTLPCSSGGGQRTFSIVSGPAHGTISGLNASTGKLTYTPKTGFNGTDSFTFRVRNPGAASNTARATIEVAKASNEFSVGKARKNKKKGTATVPIDVPGAGDLELAGKKVKPEESQAGGAGEVDLLVKAKGKAKKKLKRKGKAKVALEVTFSPSGGDPATQSANVKLVKK
jgi:hypothetical protein